MVLQTNKYWNTVGVLLSSLLIKEIHMVRMHNASPRRMASVSKGVVMVKLFQRHLIVPIIDRDGIRYGLQELCC
jgi:hypothetical protein